MTPVKVAFSPEPYPPGSPPILEDITENNGHIWTPLLQHRCSFPPEIFSQVMLNLIRNPNINSNHLFRADISLEQPFDENFQNDTIIPARIIHFHTGEVQSLVIYLPHISSPDESPFYHPKVYGIAFQHTFNPETQDGRIEIHYSFFDSEPRTQKLERTAEHLLAALYKHGQGTAAGYVKKVHHDTIIPQATVQNTYARLKAKYAKTLIENWAEVTDPEKHVFEDLNIAAFLIELWADTYKDTEFPGYVDIGCGNGLLVHILSEEGYKGWGFDARERKSWSVFGSKTREKLEELVLIPSILYSESNENQTPGPNIHDGRFPKGTFIISNHADELTPWTPILANMSQSPFMMIPCCSHALSGARYRAPPPKGSEGTPSAYASLVAWVAGLAEGCGWEVEKEWLRIPSTRNAALIGRRRKLDYEEVDVREFVDSHGGAAGWKENALKLVTGKAKNH